MTTDLDTTHDPDSTVGKSADLPEDADQWTAKVRHAAVDALPPGRLLPDRQPAYVASWIYVFGVLTLAALVFIIVSGAALAVGGINWWHTTAVGHFFNVRPCLTLPHVPVISRRSGSTCHPVPA